MTLNTTEFIRKANIVHGNPARFKPEDINKKNKLTFGKLYEITQDKRNLILSAGYNLVEIWESDWLKLQEKSKCRE